MVVSSIVFLATLPRKWADAVKPKYLFSTVCARGSATLLTSSYYAAFLFVFVAFWTAWVLIRRSPASAPLLDAVKDRKTRDAVRSVLERFGGGRKPEAAVPDAVAPASGPAAADAAKPN